MLRREIYIKSKKAMTLETIVIMILILFAMVVVVIIAKNKVDQISDSSCEANGGQCVPSGDCDACSNSVDCNLKFPFDCEVDKTEGVQKTQKLVCCKS